jgi:quercetin dioxygenase-like cupin family protein
LRAKRGLVKVCSKNSTAAIGALRLGSRPVHEETDMAFAVNAAGIAGEQIGVHVTRQRLLTTERVRNTKILLDRLALAAGATTTLDVAATDLAWFQVIEGQATLDGNAGGARIGDAHIVFLPPGYKGTISAHVGTSLLYAQVPDAGKFDSEFANYPPRFRIVDWTREPVLDSKHDARKRIYVVTPQLFGTKAIKGEMIIYPPGTEGANHHHEGAEHFMYVLKGYGTAYANEKPIAVRKGDLIYYDDFERHWLRCESQEEMAFVEFFVPGAYKTIWAPGAPICTWLPTGRDIQGNPPAREIKAHSGADETSPADV